MRMMRVVRSDELVYEEDDGVSIVRQMVAYERAAATRTR